jgi:hypothetical protein
MGQQCLTEMSGRIVAFLACEIKASNVVMVALLLEGLCDMEDPKVLRYILYNTSAAAKKHENG